MAIAEILFLCFDHCRNIGSRSTPDAAPVFCHSGRRYGIVIASPGRPVAVGFIDHHRRAAPRRSVRHSLPVLRLRFRTRRILADRALDRVARPVWKFSIDLQSDADRRVRVRSEQSDHFVRDRIEARLGQSWVDFQARQRPTIGTRRPGYRKVLTTQRGRDQDAGGRRQNGWLRWPRTCRSSCTASRRRSPAAFGNWRNAMQRRCRSWLKKSRSSPLAWTGT